MIKINQKLAMLTLNDLVERGLIKIVSIEHVEGEASSIGVGENVYAPNKVAITFESTESRRIDVSMSGFTPVFKVG